ncbi:MAG: right-handed parallel beta-helix repeat-containing protein [Candidatus Zhuqueibacterota bacterium]
MKIHTLLALLSLTLLVAFCSPLRNEKTITLYISPFGNDAWSGALDRPNETNSDGPLATFHQASERIRELKKAESASSIVIRVRAGLYPFAETLRLDSLNAGDTESRIIWQNYGDGEVTVMGGKRLTGFEIVTDTSVLDRLPAPARGNVIQLDMTANGISDYGDITQRGAPGLELFSQGQRMTPARYPNEGWLTIADVPQTGERLLNKGLEREKRFDGVPVGRHYGKIKFTSARPLHWARVDDIYLHGYWTWDWSDSYQKIEAIDFQKGEITLAEPHHHYGYTKNQRFYFLHFPEELDAPGEWYLDRDSGTVYVWLPGDPDNSEIYASVLDQPLISLSHCNGVRLEGMSFKYSRGQGVTISGGTNNAIAGCDFSFLGDDAVVIIGGSNNGITSSDIHDVAKSGILLKSGSRKTLTPAHNFATNNYIHHYSTWVRTGQYAIFISGVGQYVAHNVIHDAPHEGMYICGNDHLLEYNEIFNVCNETGDAGATHTGRNYTWRGNEYRYNYFHHLKGPGLHGVTAIYLDDFASGFKIYGNICYKSGRGALLGGGRDNLVQNNVFIACQPSIVLDARGLSWASYYFDGTYPVLFDSLKALTATEPPYSEKYPELRTLLDDDPAVPKNNRILNNISVAGKWIELYDFFAYDLSVITMKNNVIADSIICKHVKTAPAGWEPYYLNLDNEAGYIYHTDVGESIAELFKDNLVLKENPGFVNFEKEDFRLKENSPAFATGFKQIPVEKIGLRVDEYRKSLPRYRD